MFHDRDASPPPQQPHRLWCKAPGLWLPGRVRRILQLSGLSPRPVLPASRPAPGDRVAVWGQSPLAPPAEAWATRHGLPLIRLEDAFLRSLAPGRARRRGDGPLGLMIDRQGGVHFDPGQPSQLETLLSSHPLDDTALLDRARDGIARLHLARLSKYNLHDPDLPPPAPGYVLVVDQTRDDAAIRASGAGYGSFREMLFRAQDDHPGRAIVIRSHPETLAGLRPGHFGPEDIRPGISFCPPDIAPQDLLEGAVAVYTVSSQLGFEAILAGHRPQVFGRPFYAGWGLSEDHGGPLPRRHRPLTRAQLFAAAMILAPSWYDPCRDRLCSLEEAIDQLEAEVRAWRQDRHGYTAAGIRLWKRGAVQGFFGGERPVRFIAPPAPGPAALGGAAVNTAPDAPAKSAAPLGPRRLVWGTTPSPAPVWRLEDGLIRSRGLGADLVPPLSLVIDDLGLYYDPARPSRLEALIATPLAPHQTRRTERLVAGLVARGVTKYNLGGDPPPDLPPDLPVGRRILVPGQVADDASLRLGGGAVDSNLALLQRVRAENPGAVVLWKPHPDVEAGLRPGAVAARDLAGLADVTLTGVDAATALGLADEVWTMTSGLGFEALLRGLPVTTLGAPFYAGWGLTRDLGPIPARRQARPGLFGLAHAVLIAYPRYRDPISGRPCPPEVVVERIADGRVLPRSATLRLLAKAQGLAAPWAGLWRGRR